MKCEKVGGGEDLRQAGGSRLVNGCHHVNGCQHCSVSPLTLYRQQCPPPQSSPPTALLTHCAMACPTRHLSNSSTPTSLPHPQRLPGTHNTHTRYARSSAWHGGTPCATHVSSCSHQTSPSIPPSPITTSPHTQQGSTCQACPPSARCCPQRHCLPSLPYC